MTTFGDGTGNGIKDLSSSSVATPFCPDISMAKVETEKNLVSSSYSHTDAAAAVEIPEGLIEPFESTDDITKNITSLVFPEDFVQHRLRRFFTSKEVKPVTTTEEECDVQSSQLEEVASHDLETSLEAFADVEQAVDPEPKQNVTEASDKDLTTTSHVSITEGDIETHGISSSAQVEHVNEETATESTQLEATTEEARIAPTEAAGTEHIPILEVAPSTIVDSEEVTETQDLSKTPPHIEATEEATAESSQLEALSEKEPRSSAGLGGQFAAPAIATESAEVADPVVLSTAGTSFPINSTAVFVGKVVHPTSSNPTMLVPLTHPMGNPSLRFPRSVPPSSLVKRKESEEEPLEITLLEEEESEMVSDQEHAQNIAGAKAVASQLASLAKSSPSSSEN